MVGLAVRHSENNRPIRREAHEFELDRTNQSVFTRAPEKRAVKYILR